ncbi:MAG: hypothetical protein K2Q11_11750, partial [Burkholderiaceae bacterium]|nr:hypothetical protein [Burkholderiaceae bacterium]
AIPSSEASYSTPLFSNISTKLRNFFKAPQHYHPQPQLSPKPQNHQSKKNQSAAKPSIMAQLTPPTQTL